MPTNNPTGYETYIYDHKSYPNSPYDGKQYRDDRQHQGPLHDPSKLPDPESEGDRGPFIMVEPCYASESKDVFIHFRHGHSFMLPRIIAEQLRDALIKVCEKS
jgi:hypothetical protein